MLVLDYVFSCILKTSSIHLMRTSSAQLLIVRPRPSFVLWALLAMWLQVIFSGLHLASAAHALGGASDDEALIWTICTAQGIGLAPDGPRDRMSHETDTYCGLCASGVADSLDLGKTQSAIIDIAAPSDRVLAFAYRDRSQRWQSPRVGSTRAPPRF